ncbi:MAG: hypothetical protein PHR21_05710 [Oscillospiraceae bacterium]|nr:hypothetical protein [Oscillospiraceae bacterium]MDD4368054.1 hypothetical protein [Oscillospiraceae bacterium]
MKRRKHFSPMELAIKIIIGLLSLICIFPFYQTLLISLSRQGDKYTQLVFLYPVHLDISAYKYLINDGKVVNGFLVTVFITVVGTALSLALTIPGAYALTKKQLPGRNLIMNLIIFTMFFSGGLVCPIS